MYEKTFAKYEKDFPTSVKYVRDNMQTYTRCVRCNSPVLRQPETGEDNPNEFPYQCMWCDENLYHLEVHAGSPATDEELDRLIKDVIYSYELDWRK